MGGPSILCKVKLRDLPDMKYRVTDSPPRGEIMIFSQTIMKGYYKLPEKSAEDLENGWIRTGDVGIIMPNGGVKIVDRVKSLFKL
jgi:long-chain acyl-CoA synthetase